MKKIIFRLVGISCLTFTAWAQATSSYIDTCKFQITWAPYGPKTCMLFVNHSQSILEMLPKSFASQIVIPENIGGVGDKDHIYSDTTVTVKKWPEDALFFTGSIANYQALVCDDVTCRVVAIPREE